MVRHRMPASQYAVYFLSLFFALVAHSVFSQTAQLEGYLNSRSLTNGPSDTGSDVPAILGYNAGTSSTFTPSAISYSISFSNQQYTTTPTYGLTAGASASNGPTASAGPFWVPQNDIQGTTAGVSSNFTANPAGPAGTGINPSQNYAMAILTRASYLAGQSVVGRRYFGDLTVTFSEPVTNPVIHITEMGGGYAAGTGDNYIAFFSELDLTTPGITLNKLSGTTAFSVGNGSIFSSATSAGGTNSLSDYIGNGSKASSGSVLIQTSTPVTSVTFSVFLRSFGGATSNPGFPPATTTFGDRFNLGVSLDASSLALPTDLSISKIGPASVLPNSGLSYKLLVTNNGPAAVTNAVVIDNAVANFTATSVSCNAGPGDGGTAVCPGSLTINDLQGSGLVIPYIPAQGSITLTINGTSGINGATINNTASVNTPTGTTDSNQSNNTSATTTTIGTCSATQTVYSLNATSTLSSAGTIGADGGTVNLVYTLTSGPAVAGLGNSFTIPVTYSDLNNTISATNHTWANYNTITADFKGTGNSTVFSLVPNLSALAAAVPSPNNVSVATLPGSNTDQSFTNAIQQGTIRPFGIIDLNIGAIPSLPAGVKIIDQSLDIFSSNNSDGTHSFWIKALDQPLTNTSATAATTPLTVSHGQSYKFRYSAVTPDGAMVGGNQRGLLIGYGSITFCAESLVQLAGNVFNDVNGLNGSPANTVDGVTIQSPSGTQLHANLFNEAGQFVATTPLDASGAYTFTNVAPSTNYQVTIATSPASAGSDPQASVSLPDGWVNTGESNNGLGTLSDGTINGIATVNMGTENVNNINFGIEQTPETAVNLQPVQTIPAGTGNVIVPASAFVTSNVGSNPNTGDPAPGAVTGIVLTDFPANATSITIDDTLYTTLAAITTAYPNGIPTDASGQPTIAIAVDPQDGVENVIIPIASIDAAGQQDPTPGSITIPFEAPLSISGNVFNDANGLSAPDNTVNGTLVDGTDIDTATPGQQALYVSLVENDSVVSTTQVSSSGDYKFDDVAPGTYSIVLTTSPGGNISSSLPLGWGYTGEHIGTNPGGDGATDGILLVTVTDQNIQEANFGINLAPVSVPVDQQISQPMPGEILTLDGNTGNPPAPQGIDSEEGPLNNHAVTVTSLPVNGILSYNGSPVQQNVPILNFQPSLLTIELVGTGYESTSFLYTFTDAAGVSSQPTMYRLAWPDPLPVTLASFNVAAEQQVILLSWSTTSEVNSEQFVIEHSLNGNSWNQVGTVRSKEESSVLTKYQYIHKDPIAGNNFYRLKMVDKDGTFAYSQIRTAKIDVKLNFFAYPNPTVDKLTINLNELGGTSNIKELTLTSLSGSLRIHVDVVRAVVDTKPLPAGTYILTATTKNGQQLAQKVIINK